MLPLNIGLVEYLKNCVKADAGSNLVAGPAPGFGPRGFRLNLFLISFLIDKSEREEQYINTSRQPRP